jgi:AhpD family alkylhydroperoxidase
MDYPKISKDTYQHLLQSYKSIETSSLEPQLRALIYLRTSQINGCSYCCNLHQEEAKQVGILKEKLNSLNNWRLSDDFTNKEKAALNWCEVVTNLEENPAIIRDSLLNYFNEKEIVDMTFAISIMNAFNRMAISFK